MQLTTRKIGTAAVLTALVLLTGFSPIKEMCEGFLPENDLKIPVGFKSMELNSLGVRGGLTQADFNTVIDRAEAIYTEEVRQAGGVLKVNRLWTDETVNASAQRSGSTWIVNMYGGLARHNEITMDGFALVLCHEIGHHLGGAPKYAGFFNTWGTNEGGADYFSTLKCLRRVFQNDDNAKAIENMTIDPIVRNTCATQFTNQTEQDVCLRNAMAGDSVAGLFMALRNETVRPVVGTPDVKQVTKTQDGHPATQCRYDTYYQGAICAASKDAPVSNTDYRQGSCTTGTEGIRPRCWFKPN